MLEEENIIFVRKSLLRGRKMEWLDVVDENGIPTGEKVERTIAHEKGIRHRTAHVWLLRKGADGVEVLLQKRSKNKDSHPGCYDISSAGHIPAGVEFLPSAVRELKEELGICAQEQELQYCGQRKFLWEDRFYGKRFVDNQVSNVYCLWKDISLEECILQKEEVEEVIWMNLKECKQKVQAGSIPNCIMMEELNMLPEYKKKI